MTTCLIEYLDSSLALHALLFDIGWYYLLQNSDVQLAVRVTHGPSKYLDIWDLPDEEEIELLLNSMHQLVDNRVRTFTGFLWLCGNPTCVWLDILIGRTCQKNLKKSIGVLQRY